MLLHPLLSSLSYVGLGNGSDLSAPRVLNATALSFDLGNPFKGASGLLNLLVRFAPHSIINDTLLSFEFHVRTTSELVVDASTYVTCVVVRRAELKIGGSSWPPVVNYGGGGAGVRGESALRDVAEIGPLVQHRYQVRNFGPSEVDVVTVRVKWPYQVENGRPQGKWLLYLTDQPVLRNGNGFCTLPAGQAPNPLNLTSKSETHAQGRDGIRRGAKDAKPAPPENLFSGENGASDVFIAEKFYSSDIVLDGTAVSAAGAGGVNFLKRRRRRRREIEQIVAPIRVPSRAQSAESGTAAEELVVRLDCELGTAKCLVVTCQVYNLPARHSVTLEIRARLWNSTLVEDYYQVQGSKKGKNTVI
jgi:integrin alpha 7